jgi:hypothetical protein
MRPHTGPLLSYLLRSMLLGVLTLLPHGIPQAGGQESTDVVCLLSGHHACTEHIKGIWCVADGK